MSCETLEVRIRFDGVLQNPNTKIWAPLIISEMNQYYNYTAKQYCAWLSRNKYYKCWLTGSISKKVSCSSLFALNPSIFLDTSSLAYRKWGSEIYTGFPITKRQAKLESQVLVWFLLLKYLTWGHFIYLYINKYLWYAHKYTHSLWRFTKPKAERDSVVSTILLVCR